MVTTAPTGLDDPRLPFLLARADDGLILGHRLSEWCGRGPMLEEDLALSNIGLDLIGQARALYGYAAEVEGGDRDEDAFAYRRDVRRYRNLLLVEQPNGDFGQTIMRQFLYSAFADLYWQAMTRSVDPTIAAVAAKAEKESAYHLRHSAEWVVRLGDGTTESRRRVAEALNYLWPFSGELFEADAHERWLIGYGIAVDPASLREGWRATVTATLRRATLTVPGTAWMQHGGRAGLHSEHLGHILAELQYLQRSMPGCRW